MRFGLAIPQYGCSLPRHQAITFEVAALWARRAEALGFDSVWLSDHFFYSFGRYGGDPAPIGALEPMTTLAGLAAVTSRVRLGTLVLCAPFRHPSLLAKMATTVDAISGGRFDLGVGAGWLADEFDAFGYRFGDVADRFTSLEETLGVLSALQSGAPATFEGPTVSLRDARLMGAEFVDANLSESTLAEADAQGANFRGADLSRCDLSGTNFRRANLYETDLVDATFRDTIMPDGTTRP